MDLKGRTVFVTGGNRGIGFEVCRLLAELGGKVFLGSRDVEKGRRAVERLTKSSFDVSLIQIDVSKTNSVLEAVELLQDSVDVLINNAAVLDHGTLFSQSDALIEEIVHTNLQGPILLCKHLAQPMKKRNWGRIVNVSTGMASLSRGVSGDSVGYRVTKLALNGLTLFLADTLRGTHVLVNSVDPGWVRTDMGGPMARKTPEEGAKEVLHAVLLPDDGATGTFFRNGKKVDW